MLLSGFFVYCHSFVAVWTVEYGKVLIFSCLGKCKFAYSCYLASC